MKTTALVANLFSTRDTIYYSIRSFRCFLTRSIECRKYVNFLGRHKLKHPRTHHHYYLHFEYLLHTSPLWFLYSYIIRWSDAHRLVFFSRKDLPILKKKNSVFREITPCRPTKINLVLEEHLASIFRVSLLAYSSNVGWISQDHEAFNTRRENSP
jgi:hypothetical protein